MTNIEDTSIEISDAELIIEQESNASTPSIWTKIKPILPTAGGFLIMITIGAYGFNEINKWLNNLTTKTPGSGYNSERDDPLGNYGAYILGGVVGALLSTAAFGCCLLRQDPISNQNNATPDLVTTNDVTPTNEMFDSNKVNNTEIPKSTTNPTLTLNV